MKSNILLLTILAVTSQLASAGTDDQQSYGQGEGLKYDYKSTPLKEKSFDEYSTTLIKKNDLKTKKRITKAYDESAHNDLLKIYEAYNSVY